METPKKRRFGSHDFSDTSGDCEAKCALGHKWQTRYVGKWKKEAARPGKRRIGMRHVYTLDNDRCPACGHKHAGFSPTSFAEDNQS